MRILRYSLVLLLVLALSAPAPAQVRRIVVGPGEIRDNTYLNHSIGVSYQFPAGWIGIAGPPAAGAPAHEVRLLRAFPRNAGEDHRLVTLDAIAQKQLPADQRDDAARFLTASQVARSGALNDGRERVPVRGPYPTDVSDHPFERAEWKLAAPANAAAAGKVGVEVEIYETQVAGVANGHMLLLSAVASTADEANELADTAEALSLLPPDDPDEVPGAPPPIPHSPTAVKRVHVSEKVILTHLRARVEPEYPAEARDRGVEGEVLLEVLVGPDGSVAQATVLSGHPLLNAAALAAVRQWKFDPYQVDGVAVEAETRVRVTFSLASAKRSS